MLASTETNLRGRMKVLGDRGNRGLHHGTQQMESMQKCMFAQ
jgi:hypothetical protein